jgi:hypothetical protein
MDIASASGMRRPGFESRQGKRFLGKHRSAIVCVLKGEIKALATKIYIKKTFTLKKFGIFLYFLKNTQSKPRRRKIAQSGQYQSAQIGRNFSVREYLQKLII